MDGKYLFNPTYNTEEYENIQYWGIIMAYFVELVNDLINEVNDIAECDDLVPVADVREYITSEFDYVDREEIIQDITEMLPYGTDIDTAQVFHIGKLVADNLLHQYGDDASP